MRAYVARPTAEFSPFISEWLGTKGARASARFSVRERLGLEFAPAAQLADIEAA